MESKQLIGIALAGFLAVFMTWFIFGPAPGKFHVDDYATTTPYDALGS